MNEEKQFVRNEDGTYTVPGAVVTVSTIFHSDSTEGAVHNLINLVGEANAITLGEFVYSIETYKHEFLLGMLAEGWRSNLPLRPVLDVLLLLDRNFTLRALVAQRVCTASPDLAKHLLPFYRATSGLEGIGGA